LKNSNGFHIIYFMPDYRRYFYPGGTFFLTVVTHGRRAFLCQDKARDCLRTAINKIRCQHAFESVAFVLLPDHFHCVWKLPEGDSDFSIRLGRIKREFTQTWLGQGGDEQVVSTARRKHRERGIWQKRFWEHTIRDDEDLIHHVNYIHYNPVKHGLADCPHKWPFSTFHRWAKEGYYSKDWLCNCGIEKHVPLNFDEIGNTAGE
jgi:putative transposase